MKLRFAPSPTGYLHVGNVRTALVNFLFAKRHGGEFLLRIDDTDPERSKQEYTDALQEDLSWLGMVWDQLEHQNARLARYEEIKQQLIDAGRLYPCYETEQELDVKRKMQLGRGLPPIYDRAALKLSDAEKAAFEAEGRQPHWRFRLDEGEVAWDDLVRGRQSFEGRHMSDPILLRGDGSPTYMLPSCVDDMDFGVTHVLRGEDHVSNTAIQIQLFEALGAVVPTFGHFSLLKTKEGGISKRDGGYDIRTLREKGYEAMSVISLLSRLGTSEPVEVRTTMQEVIDSFEIDHFGKAPANYDEAELERLNAKLVSQLRFADVADQLKQLGLDALDESFWNTIRPNLSKVNEAKEWWGLCHEAITPDIEDAEYAATAAAMLPQGELTRESWQEWTTRLKEATGRKGKMLFMPLRKALTGRAHGPDMADVLPLIDPEKIKKRLSGKKA